MLMIILGLKKGSHIFFFGTVIIGFETHRVPIQSAMFRSFWSDLIIYRLINIYFEQLMSA